MAEGPSGEGHWIRRMVRTAPDAVQIALRMLGGETVQLRAMALTYISLFALVPGLVVAFSVVQAFTGMHRIQERLHNFVFENLAVGARNTIEPYIDRFIQNTHVTSAGLVGGALLIWSSVSLFQNVDRALNDIWGVRRRRSLSAQATIYWVGITLGPLLLAGSVMLGHSTRSFASARLGVPAAAAGALLTCSFFSLAYLIVPNTKVRPRNAVAGGIIAGVAWEIAKWGYATFVARSVKYSAIYGSVAAVPIFVLWLYVSWTILLFGARLAYVFQYASSFVQGVHSGSRLGREITAGRTLLAVARAFDGGEAPPDPGELANQLGVPADDVSDAVSALKTAGLVVTAGDGALLPARPLEKLTLLDVRRAVGGDEPPAGAAAEVVAAVVRGVEEDSGRRLGEVTLRSLCDREREARPAERAPATQGAGQPAGTSVGAG